MKEKSIFYSYDKMLSYNALLNFIIGERGVGKSYGAKKYVVNKFLKKKKQFAYIRRYKTELKSAMMKKGKPMFFDQIKNDDVMKNVKFSNTNDVMYLNDQVCGYALPLSTANILKSSTYDDVDTIIFDEFIIDKGIYRYLNNEVEQVLDLIETIGRLRDVKVIFLGNAISSTNPYFTYFDLTLPYNSEFKLFKDGLILVNYVKNQIYRDVKKDTKFGKLISGTKYSEFAIDNQFLRDSKHFIRKKTKLSKFYFTLKINNVKYGIWRDYKESSLFVSEDYDPLCPVIFTISNEDHNEETMMIRFKTSPFLKSLLDYYKIGYLFFENQRIKNNVIDKIIKNLNC